MYFLGLLQVRYNCAKFHHCRICVTDFRDWAFLPPPPPPTPPMKFFVNFRIFSTELLWVGISCNFKILLIAALIGYGYLYFEFRLPVEMEKFLLVKMDWTQSLPFCYWLKWHKFWILLFKFIKLSNQKIAKLSFQSVFRKVCPFSVGYFRSSFWSTFAIF